MWTLTPSFVCHLCSQVLNGKFCLVAMFLSPLQNQTGDEGIKLIVLRSTNGSGLLQALCNDH